MFEFGAKQFEFGTGNFTTFSVFPNLNNLAPNSSTAINSNAILLDAPTTTDVNTLMILTRELTSQIPKSENLLTSIGGFGLDFVGLETIGLPESGDIVIDVGGVPHIKTEFGELNIFLQLHSFKYTRVQYVCPG